MEKAVSIWMEKSLLGTNTSQTVIVDAGQNILQTLQYINIRLRQPVAAIVNGKTVDLTEYILQPGDNVQLIPQIGGG
jgi:sulfur carrier protein ThiS